MASLQKQFEQDVKNIKTEADKLKLTATSSHYNYGKDPHKSSSNLGKRKSLPRACSNVIRRCLFPKWIPQECELQYCTLSKGKNACCYNPEDYEFGEILNLKSLIIGALFQLKSEEKLAPNQRQHLNLNQLEPQNEKRITKAIMNDTINEKTENGQLEVMINHEFVLKFYIKRVKQDRLAKSMDIAQVLFVYDILYLIQILSESKGMI